MKSRNKYFLTILFILFFSGNYYIASADDKETVRAIPANDFLNTIGANSAIWGRGENMSKTIDCCKYTGIRWIRTAASSSPDSVAKFYNLSGIKVCCGLGSANPTINYNLPRFIERVKQIAQSGALLAVEGLNEPNNWKVRYENEIGGGKDGTWMPVAKLQRDLYKAVKEDPVLKDYPVWGISATGATFDNCGLQFLTIPEDADTLLMPAGTQFADYVNCHNYFIHGNPRTNNQTWKAADPLKTASPIDGLYVNHGLTWNKKFPGYTDEELVKLPRVTTETGTTIQNFISEKFQALMYTSAYLAQFKRGWSYTSMYILRDRSDESGNQSFGFYDKTYKPRLSATYLHNLTTILSDNESIQNPSELTYSVSPSRPETVHELLLQKKDGTLMLVVWGEKYAINSVADNIEIKFEKMFDKINVYNVTEGIEPIQTYTNVNSIPLSMLNYPYILEINPKMTSSVKNAFEKKIKVYPNPVKDNLWISDCENLKDAIVTDIFGKTVWQQQISGESNLNINMENLSKGIYILHLKDDSQKIENIKILKQ